MNITQILLGFTAALLFGAIILSYGEMKSGEKQHGLQQDAGALMQDSARLQAELDRLRGGAVIPEAEVLAEVEVPIEVDTTMIEKMKAEQASLRQQLAEEEALNGLAAEEVVEVEPESLVESQPERVNGRLSKEARSARNISIATLMARVGEIAKQGDISVIVLNVLMPDRVQMNTELAIRRESKIIGSVVVSNIVSGNVFADPIQGTFPGDVIDVRVGDELIIAPTF